jgi:hypothetical protein
MQVLPVPPNGYVAADADTARNIMGDDCGGVVIL